MNPMYMNLEGGMRDSSDTGVDAPRSRADQHLRDLVKLMQTGAPAQIERAQMTFYDTLFRQLSRAGVARGIDPDRFKDLFQETMIAVWKQLPGFRGEASMVTWVHQIFRHKLADFLRSAGHRRVIQLDDEMVEELVSGDSDIAEALSQNQVREFLEGCLRKLRSTAYHRAASIEFARQGCSTEEISVFLDAPVGTVKRWLLEARRALAACLIRHGVTDADG
jgi:RNA polymerase sigma-70 factor (ECF subfamily)